MKTSYARIAGWGHYVPPKVVTNRDLTQLVDTTDEWIRERTGILERRMAGPDETSATMGAQAARAALEVAGLDPKEVELVILATVSSDYILPATASLVQHAIGATKAGAFDLNAGCSGFVYALSIASRLIESGAHQNVLVIGSEAITRFVDFADRGTCVLFGDGAGAVVLQASTEPTGLLSCVLGSDGSGADSLIVPAGGSRCPSSVESVQMKKHFIKMKGNEVYRFAVSAMTQASREAIEQAGLRPEDIDLFIPHQANLRIIQLAAKALKLPPEKVFINVERYGNTSAASIPIALSEAIEQGRVHAGDRIVMVGFGAGLSWAAAVIQWGVGTRVDRTLWGNTASEAQSERVGSIVGQPSGQTESPGKKNGSGS